MSCDFRHDDAAFVLGALPADERAAFLEHLAGCASCTRAVQELAGLPGLLGRVPAEVLAGPPDREPVPPTLLPALVRRVRRERQRRTWTILGAAAAIVAAVAGGSVVATHALDDGRPPAVAQPVIAGEPMQPVGSGSMTANLALTQVAWGTKLELVCHYAEHEKWGKADDANYAMFVRTRGGAVEQVATWRALPGRTMHLSAATAEGRDDISSVEIRTADGTPVLRLGS